MSPFFYTTRPSVFKRTLRATIVACLVLTGSSAARGQLVEGNVVLAEFFEELYVFDANSGTVADVLDNEPTETILIDNAVGLNSNTVILSSFSDLYRYDVPTATSSFFTTLPFTPPSEITRDLNGNLIATAPGEVYRIDGATGDATLLHTETFFSADDAVVDQNGTIFVTEFFDALGAVNPNGGFTQIGDFSSNQFSNLDIGIDGQLYLASTIGGEFWRVDPVSGEGTLLGEELFLNLDDLQVDDNGDLLFSATVGAEDGLFLFDLETAQISNLIDADDVNDGFFSPSDVDIFATQFRSTSFVPVPEPGSVGLFVLAMVGISTTRRRQ